jgi:hypothetical protein
MGRLWVGAVVALVLTVERCSAATASSVAITATWAPLLPDGACYGTSNNDGPDTKMLTYPSDVAVSTVEGCKVKCEMSRGCAGIDFYFLSSSKTYCRLLRTPAVRNCSMPGFQRDAGAAGTSDYNPGMSARMTSFGFSDSLTSAYTHSGASNEGWAFVQGGLSAERFATKSSAYLHPRWLHPKSKSSGLGVALPADWDGVSQEDKCCRDAVMKGHEYNPAWKTTQACDVVPGCENVKRTATPDEIALWTPRYVVSHQDNVFPGTHAAGGSKRGLVLALNKGAIMSAEQAVKVDPFAVVDLPVAATPAGTEVPADTRWLPAGYTAQVDVRIGIGAQTQGGTITLPTSASQAPEAVSAIPWVDAGLVVTQPEDTWTYTKTYGDCSGTDLDAALATGP